MPDTHEDGANPPLRFESAALRLTAIDVRRRVWELA